MARSGRVWLVVGLACFALMGVVGEAWAAAPRADFCVAPGGDDAGPGTVERPFATLPRARDAVRAKIAKGLEAGVLVLVRGGVYRVAEPVVFGPEDGGTGNRAVTYAAWPGETPVLSGGRAIAAWKAEGDVWKAAMPDVKAGTWTFRELFVGGQRRPRARHPNDGFLRVAKVVDRRHAFQFGEGDLPALGEAGEAELLLLHDWSVSRNPIASVDAATRTLTTRDAVGGPSDFWNIDGFEPNPRYLVENHPALLDAPGEWYLDRAAGVLSYRPMPGEKIEGFEAIAPVAPQLIVVRGSADGAKPVRNLHFAGLALEHAAWMPAGGRYAGGQACFHWSGPGKDVPKDQAWQAVTPAVLFEMAEGCTLKGCTLARLGGSGLWFGRACHGCRFSRGRVTDVSGNGIMIGEGQTREGRDVATGNVVEHSIIEACGVQYFGAVGAWVGLAAGNAISHNEIARHPYTGVSVGWMWNPSPTPCKGNRVEYNNIHHCMQTLSDGGGIYTLGWQPGAALRGNWIHDIPRNAGRAESNGMFIDEGSTDLAIEGNLIHGTDRSPFRFHQAGKNLVKGNVVVLNAGVPIVRFNNTPEPNIAIEANTEVPQADVAKEAFEKAAEPIRRAAGPRP